MSERGGLKVRLSASRPALVERLEMVQIEVIEELLSDLEKEDAEDQHGNQHIERHAEFDDHGRTRRSRSWRQKKQAIFHKKESPRPETSPCAA